MKKISCLIIFFFYISNMSAATIKAVDGAYGSNTNLSETVNKQLDSIATDLNTDPMVRLAGNQNKLTKSNANANASNTIVGSLYSGFDAGIAAIGFTGAAAAYNPDKVEDLINDVEDGKDTEVGASIGGFGVSAIYNGDNLQNLPIKGLIFEAKFALYSNEDIYGANYSSFIIGGGARYKLASLPVQNPVFKMRALTVGTGLYYSQTDISFDADPIKKNSDPESVDGEEVITRTTTTLDFSIASKTLIIPCEVVTSAQTFYIFNVIAGTGFDLSLGQTKTTVQSDSEIEVLQGGVLQTPTDKPDLKLTKAETRKYPSVLRYKLILGLGLNLGPTRIEVPVAFYPTKGYAASAIIGASF